jgi:hypothetical protein
MFPTMAWLLKEFLQTINATALEAGLASKSYVWISRVGRLANVVGRNVLLLIEPFRLLADSERN